MTDLRLVSIDGERTIPVDLSGIALAARSFADQVDAGKLDIERCIIVGIVDGAVTYIYRMGQDALGSGSNRAIGAGEPQDRARRAGAWLAPAFRDWNAAGGGMRTARTLLRRGLAT